MPPPAAQRAAVESVLGELGAALFASTFVAPLETAVPRALEAFAQGRLPHGELAAWGSLQREGHAAALLLLALPTRAQSRFVRQWALLLAQSAPLVADARMSLERLRELPADSQAALTAQGAPGDELLRGAAALCTVSRLLRAALEHHCSYWHADAVSAGAAPDRTHARVRAAPPPHARARPRPLAPATRQRRARLRRLAAKRRRRGSPSSSPPRSRRAARARSRRSAAKMRAR